ncbi:MAG: inositol-3-phosphate synthase [Candidatus Micrarchaeota archaeon]|nr:inositol-3-phosphate synthase [Candidatus Micrarchaeota archaeon]
MPINVAIIGTGNCAKSLVEGVAFYSKNKNDKIGLMNPNIGKYHPSDIRFVAAFDIDERKVGKKLGEALNTEPNRTVKIADIPEHGVIVQRGPTHDSVIPELREYFIHESDRPAVDVARVLKDSGAEIAVNYLPTGSDKATYAYAEAALAAGCSFINCMPTPIAKSREWQGKFAAAGLVLMGDDIKSQCGATIVNRVLLDLFKMRGIRVTKSEQVNYGGNCDHFNLHYRPEAKEESKESALNSVLDADDAKPSARMIYTEKNYDHKKARIKIDGEIFGHVPVSIDLTLEDEDSPNSGGVVNDAIRAARLLTENGKPHLAKDLCAFLFKAPPEQLPDSEALQKFRKTIGSLEQEPRQSRKPARSPPARGT